MTAKFKTRGLTQPSTGISRDSKKSRQKSAKNTAYFQKNHEKHGKNTASKCNVFLVQKFKLINVHLVGRDCHSVIAICLASSIEYHHNMKS